MPLLAAAGPAGGQSVALPEAGSALQGAPLLEGHALWAAWKASYLTPEGRIVDRLQQDASHSEGQGYGLLLAAEFADQAAFELIRDWTEANLAVRPDPLLSWRWLPESDQRVPDPNNASDGDLFFAWGLVRGWRQFGEPRYLERAVQIAGALSDTCLRESPLGDGRLLLLPAVHGFVHEGQVVFNPSYVMPRALRELAEASGAVRLAQAASDGEAIIAELAATGLVPDWVSITASGMAPAEGFSANTGYEALRVPLYLIWSGQPQHPAVTAMQRLYDATVLPGDPVPTRIEPSSGVVLEASADAGYMAIAGLVLCAGNGGSAGAPMPPFDPGQPYYPATLQLFAMIASQQVLPRCVPV